MPTQDKSETIMGLEKDETLNPQTITLNGQTYSVTDEAGKVCVEKAKEGGSKGGKKSRKPKKKTSKRKSIRRRKGGNPMKFGGSLSFSELNAAAPTKSVGGTAAVKNITGGNANVSSASVSNMFKGLIGGTAVPTKLMGGNTHVSSASIGGTVPKLMGGNTHTPKSMGGKKRKNSKRTKK